MSTPDYLEELSYSCKINNIIQNSDFQAGWLVLKSSGGEWAWFLAEGSELRNKLILLAGKNQRAEELACLMKVGSINHS